MNTIDNDTGEVIAVRPAFTPRKVKAPRGKATHPAAPVDGVIRAVSQVAGLPVSVERTIVKAAHTVQQHGKGMTAGALLGIGLFAAFELYQRTKK